MDLIPVSLIASLVSVMAWVKAWTFFRDVAKG